MRGRSAIRGSTVGSEAGHQDSTRHVRRGHKDDLVKSRFVAAEVANSSATPMKFVAANGEQIKDLGENVVKHLVSMHKVFRAGSTVVSDAKNPHIRNTRDGTVIKLDVGSWSASSMASNIKKRIHEQGYTQSDMEEFDRRSVGKEELRCQS